MLSMAKEDIAMKLSLKEKKRGQSTLAWEGGKLRSKWP